MRIVYFLIGKKKKQIFRHICRLAGRPIYARKTQRQSTAVRLCLYRDAASFDSTDKTPSCYITIEKNALFSFDFSPVLFNKKKKRIVIVNVGPRIE